MPRRSVTRLVVSLVVVVFMDFSSHAQRSEPTADVNVPDVVEANWRTIIDPLGRTSRQPYFYQASNADIRRAEAVLRTDEAYRHALANRDVAAADRILSNQFAGIEPTGAMANRRTTLERFPALVIQGVELNRVTIRFNGDVATVTGEETRITPAAREDLLFSRTYALIAGAWRLVSNTEFRDPR